ncbi:Uma2 family endonuclease [soil metagenome]
MMASVRTATPVTGTRMTLDEWAALPGEDVRSELVDGLLVVTTAPSEPHQAAVGELFMLLRAACPPELRVRVGPLGVLVHDLTSGLMPDLLVLREDDRGGLDRLPVLVVEVLSPSTRGRDQLDKRRLYQHRGIASYWLIDPEVPDLRVLELGGSGEYVEVSYTAFVDVVELHRPFAVRLSPARLTG